MFTNSCTIIRFVYKGSALSMLGSLPSPVEEGKHGGMWNSSRRRAEQRTQSMVLIVSLAWMVLIQLGCVVCWDSGLLTRQASLLHWLVVGVLPPALALWTSETERTRR